MRAVLVEQRRKCMFWSPCDELGDVFMVVDCTHIMRAPRCRAVLLVLQHCVANAGKGSRGSVGVRRLSLRQVLPAAAIEEEEAEEEEEEEEPSEALQPVAEVAEAAKPLGGLFGRAKRGAKAAADEAEELADEAPQVPARRAAAPHALWRHLVSRCVPGPVVLVLVCSCTTAHRSAKATAEQ